MDDPTPPRVTSSGRGRGRLVRGRDPGHTTRAQTPALYSPVLWPWASHLAALDLQSIVSALLVIAEMEAPRLAAGVGGWAGP